MRSRTAASATSDWTSTRRRLGLFSEDLSDEIVQDDVLMRLLTFPNVIITAHQAYFTSDALRTIAEVTLANVSAFERSEKSGNEVGLEWIRG